MFNRIYDANNFKSEFSVFSCLISSAYALRNSLLTGSCPILFRAALELGFKISSGYLDFMAATLALRSSVIAAILVFLSSLFFISYN